MDLLLSVLPRKEASVIRSILNNRKAFTKIKNLQAYSDEKGSFVIVTLDMGILNVIEASKLQAKYEKIKYVLSATATQTIEDDFKSNIKDKNCHFFFDIDSTLTKGGLGTIHRTIRHIFENMKEDGYRIYFVSGRSEAQVKEDMTAFDTEPYGIAEN